MLNSISGVNDPDVSEVPSPNPFAATGLDSVESDPADEARAALECGECPNFDPLGLYALEVERDEAFNEAVRALPATAQVEISTTRRIGNSGWTEGGGVQAWAGCTIYLWDGNTCTDCISHTARTPTQAVASALAEYHKRRNTAAVTATL